MYNNTKSTQKMKVACYDIRPGNREGLFWFRHFILSLTYLLNGQLPTYLQPRDPHRAHQQFALQATLPVKITSQGVRGKTRCRV